MVSFFSSMHGILLLFLSTKFSLPFLLRPTTLSTRTNRCLRASSSPTTTQEIVPIEILEALSVEQRGPHGVAAVLRSLLAACRIIGTALREDEFTSSLTGTSNVFGDKQLDVDVQADKCIFDCLTRSGVVHVAASEENPIEIDCNYQHSTSSNGFSVAFDPLDGSSIVDANFAVGTIAGIWPGNGFLGRYGHEQSASLMCIYGPKVTMALALNHQVTKNNEAISVELTMGTTQWKVTNRRFLIATKCTTFAPGNLRATNDNVRYKSLIDYWMNHKYTLRYSGGLVPDVYHILVKGQGVLANPSSKLAIAKLRLLFEAAPIALLIEAAGGASCVYANELEECEDTLPVSVLEIPITHLDRRVGLCLGSTDEVNRFKQFLFGTTAYTRYTYTIEDNTKYE